MTELMNNAYEPLIRTKLFASDACYRSIVETSSDSILIIDEREIVVFANSVTEQLLGYPLEDLIGSSLTTIIPPRLRAAHLAGFSRYAKSNERRLNWRSVQMPALHKDGHEVPVSIAFSEFIFGKSRFFTGVLRDMTAAEEAAAKLEAQRAELRESEQRYALALASTTDSIWDRDLVRDRIFYSPRLRDVLGFSQSEFPDTVAALEEHLHPDDRDTMAHRFERHLTAHYPYDFEIRLRTAQGEWRWFRTRGQAVWDEKGTPIRMVGSFTDITSTKQATEAIQRAEAFFRGAAEQSLTGLYLLEHGRIVYANAKFAETFGYTVDELLELPTAMLLVAPSERPRIAELMAERQQKGEPVRYTAKGQRKDGSQIDVEVYGSRLVLDDKTLLVGTLLDTTERTQSHVELRRSEERFRTLFDTAPVGIVLGDAEGNLIYANPALLDMVGRPLDELVGSRWLEVIHPDDVRYLEEKKRSLPGGDDDPLPIMYRIVRPDGEIRYVRSITRRVRSETGATVSLVLAFEDCTMRHRAERALRRRTAALEQNIAARERAEVELRTLSETLERRIEERTSTLARLNAELERSMRHTATFLAEMSHELRTPLNGVIGFTELIHDGKAGPITAVQQEYLGDVLNSAHHLLRLVNDALDLAKTEAGKIKFEPESVDLTLVLDEVRRTLLAVAHERKIDVSLDVDPSVKTVVTDRRYLKQIALNYLSNALKFNRPSGRVTIHAMPAGRKHFRIEVVDNGYGIPEADRERVFEEFVQLPSLGGYSGTGLGLTLTRRIAEALGGTVGVESELGRGSVFFVMLPRVMGSETNNSDAETRQRRAHKHKALPSASCDSSSGTG